MTIPSYCRMIAVFHASGISSMPGVRSSIVLVAPAANAVRVSDRDNEQVCYVVRSILEQAHRRIYPEPAVKSQNRPHWLY